MIEKERNRLWTRKRFYGRLLSNLLRVTLNDDSGLIPLEKELSLVQSYICLLYTSRCV